MTRIMQARIALNVDAVFSYNAMTVCDARLAPG